VLCACLNFHKHYTRKHHPCQTHYHVTSRRGSGVVLVKSHTNRNKICRTDTPRFARQMRQDLPSRDAREISPTWRIRFRAAETREIALRAQPKKRKEQHARNNTRKGRRSRPDGSEQSDARTTVLAERSEAKGSAKRDRRPREAGPIFFGNKRPPVHLGTGGAGGEGVCYVITRGRRSASARAFAAASRLARDSASAAARIFPIVALGLYW
jgi:hypothetical protein